MKKHLNTLFVTTAGSYLKKDGEAILVQIQKENKLRVPLHNLDGLVCFGAIGCSPHLMGACAKAGITISFLTEYGNFQAAVVGYTSGNVLLRREQYRIADDMGASVSVARYFVYGKVANSRAVLLRAARDSKCPIKKESLQSKAKRLGYFLEQTRDAATLDQLRGIEGDVAREYFQEFNNMLTGDSVKTKDFEFTKRSKRPPMDRLNALLSFLYSMFTHDARSACEAVGLDSQVGFLHRGRAGRASLGLDLIEEFRSFLIDRLVLSLINRRQIQSSDFEISDAGSVRLTDKGRKTVLVAYQNRKQDVITHPFLQEKTTIGLLIHLQARLLARFIRGDIDAYPPFIWR